MSTENWNRYWIPALDINKKVITQELQYYLGPDATVRPYTREGEDGFLVTTPGECLTDEVWEKSVAERLGRLAPRAGAENTLKRPLHDPIVISRPLKKRQVEKEKLNSPQDYADEGEESLPRKTEHEPDSSNLEGTTVSQCRVSSYRRRAVRVLLNGIDALAHPDTCSDHNIISETFARQHGISISSQGVSKIELQLGNGKMITAVGFAYVDCRLLNSPKTEEKILFHVLSQCVIPLILGVRFIMEEELFTQNRRLLMDYPLDALDLPLPMLNYIGSPKAYIPFQADGKALLASADTGSDLDFISPECTKAESFEIDTSVCVRVLLPDTSVVETIGQVVLGHLSLEKGYGIFSRNFHVLPGLPCSIVFGGQFLEHTDAFRHCCILVEREEGSAEDLKILISLGPVQSTLSRLVKWKKTKNEDAFDGETEAEVYRRYQQRREASRRLKISGRMADPSVDLPSTVRCQQNDSSQAGEGLQKPTTAT